MPREASRAAAFAWRDTDGKCFSFAFAPLRSLTPLVPNDRSPTPTERKPPARLRAQAPVFYHGTVEISSGIGSLAASRPKVASRCGAQWKYGWVLWVEPTTMIRSARPRFDLPRLRQALDDRSKARWQDMWPGHGHDEQHRAVRDYGMADAWEVTAQDLKEDPQPVERDRVGSAEARNRRCQAPPQHHNERLRGCFRTRLKAEQSVDRSLRFRFRAQCRA